MAKLLRPLGLGACSSTKPGDPKPETIYVEEVVELAQQPCRVRFAPRVRPAGTLPAPPAPGASRG